MCLRICLNANLAHWIAERTFHSCRFLFVKRLEVHSWSLLMTFKWFENFAYSTSFTQVYARRRRACVEFVLIPILRACDKIRTKIITLKKITPFEWYLDHGNFILPVDKFQNKVDILVSHCLIDNPTRDCFDEASINGDLGHQVIHLYFVQGTTKNWNQHPTKENTYISPLYNPRSYTNNKSTRF